MYLLLVCLIVTSLQLSPLHAESPVSVHPPNPVTALGGNITFTCYLARQEHGTLQNITWLINGSTMNNPDIITQFDPAGVGLGVARFGNLGLEYNSTTIVCRGLLTSGRTFNSNGVLMLLQGTLQAAKNLNITSHDSSAFLTWIAPFTLDIYGLTVDITYTLSITSDSSLTLQMVHGLITTEYNYTLPNGSRCDNLVFTVIPMNGAGEGIPKSIQLSQAVKRKSGRNKDSDIAGFLSIIQSSPWCKAEVTLTDKVSGEIITLGNMDLNVSSTLTAISFTNERLLWNRQYMITVNASNINGSDISTGDMSTYDVVNSEIFILNHTINTEYLPNSSAAGVLYGFFYVGEHGIDFTKSAYLPLSRNTSLRYELPFLLPSGVYYVHTYVIKKNGLLSSGDIFPATTQVFSSGIDQQNSITRQRSSYISDCDINTSGLIVSVLCFYSPTSSSTGFLLVVQEKSTDGVRRLLVNTTEPGKPQGPVTVQVAMGQAYQVTVFPVREELGILDSTVAYTMEIRLGTPTLGGSTSPPPVSMSETIPIIIGVGASLGVLVVILGGVFCVVQCRRSRGLVASKKPPEMQSEEKAVTHTEVTESHGLTPGSLPVYEEIDDVKGSFSYTQNVLYGTRSTTSRLTSEPVPKLPTSRLTSDPIPKVPSVESCNQNAQNYELIQTADYERMDGTYSVQQCAAYGVSMDKSDDSTMCHDPTMSCDSNVSHDSNQSRDSNTSCDSNSSNRNFDRSCDSNRSCNGSKSSLNSKRSHDSVRSHNSNWSRYTNMSHDSNRLHDSNSSKPHNSERPHGSKSSLDSNESCDSNRSHNFNRSHNSNWSTQDSNTG